MAFEKLEDLKNRKAKILAGGGEELAQKQHSDGKLTARERIELLFDQDSFVEIGAFVRHRCTNFGMEDLDAPGDGVITGYGKVDGRLVYAYSQDSTVSSGALGEMHAGKIVTIMEHAMRIGAPMVGLCDSGGARIQEGVDVLSGYGRILRARTLASGVIPQITAIMGNCGGVASYSSALSDFLFMVEHTSSIFVAGPQVIEAHTGEKFTKEQLGGADVHRAKSGVSHFTAPDDESCIAGIRHLLGFLSANNLEFSPMLAYDESPDTSVGSLDELFCDEGFAGGSLGSSAEDLPNAYNIKDVLAVLVDHGEYMEYQTEYAPNIVTAFARIDGRAVGVVANQPAHQDGVLDLLASEKAARFIRTCDAFNIPILNLVDVPGFARSAFQEHQGLVRHGAKLMYAYAEATVPKITVVLRRAYGGSYLAMCSKELGADLVLAWPSAEIAIMAPTSAARIVYHEKISNSDDPVATRQSCIQEYRTEYASPYKAAERGYVDDIIIPSKTRMRLIEAFDMLASKRVAKPAKKHGNIPL